jgi:serine/threonine protein phosphatase PrpC
MSGDLQVFCWLGSDSMCLDDPNVAACGDVVIGRYGGSKENGAIKNEDGALVFYSNDWEFAAILDAHYTAQSASLVLEKLQEQQGRVSDILVQPVAHAFPLLHKHMFDLFNSSSFRTDARRIYGETAVLMCARKGRFVWWFCIGDCMVYLLHPELAALGQYALNQRSFYEWVGHVNTFELPIPCYSSGVRELRGGENTIVMITDGLLEYNSSLFQNSDYLYQHFTAKDDLQESIHNSLEQVHDGKGVNSATIIAWKCEVQEPVSYPSG